MSLDVTQGRFPRVMVWTHLANFPVSPAQYSLVSQSKACSGFKLDNPRANTQLYHTADLILF